MTATLTARDHRTAELELSRRLAGCLPGGTLELEAMLRLVDIQITDSVPTAAVTTGGRPRLRVNPEFVATHCASDEHLFLLVMHELWHVLLAHTRLFPRVTLAQNIAFDAIINAGLARQYPQPEYVSFFRRLNSPDTFPGRLLCPPAGWPHTTDYDGPGPKGTTQIMMRLYPIWDDYKGAEPTYRELVELIERSKEYDHLLESTGRYEPAELLGDHERDGNDDPLADQMLRDILTDVVKSWPAPPGGLRPDPRAEAIGSWESTIDPCDARNRRLLDEVLRRAAKPSRGGYVHRHVTIDRVQVQTPIPSARDRRRVARQRLGIDSVLWNSEITRRTVRADRPASAKVYLDVSGSMESELPTLLEPLIAFVSSGLAEAKQFSTIVRPLTLKDLRRGRLETTCGTAVEAVLRDALDDPRTTSIVLITDGYVEQVDDSLLIELRDRSIDVHAVISATGSAQPLDAYATITRLVA